MNKPEYCVFILTHGRANNVKTYRTLKKQGYTGEIFLLVDNEDPELDLYKKIYGDKVCIFDKEKWYKKVDNFNNFAVKKVILFARNAVYEAARQKGYRYFVQLDDDYSSFDYRFDDKRFYLVAEKLIKNLDRVFDAYFNYFINSSVDCLAMGQSGDFIGGYLSGMSKKIYGKRKAMNSFFCDTKNPIEFCGAFNEDVNAYTMLAQRGVTFLTVFYCFLHQEKTQKAKSGMSDSYKKFGTYVKSFHSVIASPSCVKVSLMGYGDTRRIHHKVNWNSAAPKILRRV